MPVSPLPPLANRSLYEAGNGASDQPWRPFARDESGGRDSVVLEPPARSDAARRWDGEEYLLRGPRLHLLETLRDLLPPVNAGTVIRQSERSDTFGNMSRRLRTISALDRKGLRVALLLGGQHGVYSLPRHCVSDRCVGCGAGRYVGAGAGRGAAPKLGRSQLLSRRTASP